MRESFARTRYPQGQKLRDLEPESEDVPQKPEEPESEDVPQKPEPYGDGQHAE